MMKKKGKMMRAAFALTVLAVLAGCSSKKGNKEASEFFRNMDTVDFDGNQVDASLFAENTITLVNLWNVGCTPCVEEMPVFEQLNEEYEGKGAAIKGLYYSAGSTLTEEEEKEIRDIMENAGASFQQLTLSEEMIQHDVIQKIQAFPTTFVVDSEGNILNKVMGSNDYDGWKSFIEEELKKAEENE